MLKLVHGHMNLTALDKLLNLRIRIINLVLLFCFQNLKKESFDPKMSGWGLGASARRHENKAYVH